ncbi:HNH endonuclease [Pseudoalteromonas sp. 1_2015MBL_MicDiv]|uniref:HNH endonuclease n=1 Tax=Pseudoalteromonas sp. 1_2015MBL_MicDiv TaxID=1720343 RepID=UPI0018E0AA2C|nr:HNH endonuclease [Pseudoalteromonas sp. 1_2015MBL_MicDiv]
MPEEVTGADTYIEGATKVVTINKYERDVKARKKCIAHFGCVCQVCGFDFEKVYGDLGKGYIHVHHIVPLSEIGKEYEVNPEEDLVPLCPNCHAMVHRIKPAKSLADLKSELNKNKL